MQKRFFGSLLLSMIALLWFAACVPSQNGSQAAAQSGPNCELVSDGYGSPGKVRIRVEKYVTGLEVPWSVAVLSDGALLITERAGRVRLIRHRQLVQKPVLSLEVGESTEGGLLGLALHPDFKTNRFFYIYYTTQKGEQTVNRVERYRLSEDRTSAQLDKLILDDIPAGALHDGGRIHFGPDRMLYIATGDARASDSAQDPSSLAGKLLRLTPDGEVPSDNPRPGKPFWLLGVRNLEAFDWINPSTMIVADHGPSGEMLKFGHDEVSFAKAGDNLGWPTIWSCEQKQGMVTPGLVWEAATPPGGGIYYTGNLIPQWKGSFLIGTLKSTHLHRVMLEQSSPPRIAGHEVYLMGEPPDGFGRLRDVIQGPNGEVYVTTSNCDGRGTCPQDRDAILKITPASQ